MQGAIMDVTVSPQVGQAESISKAIEEKIGSRKYQIWFQNSAKLSLSDGYLKIVVPNSFVANWIENHFLTEINKAVQEITGRQAKVTFTINPEPTSHTKGSELHTQSNIAEARDIRRDHIQSQRTKIAGQKKLKLSLDTFVVGSSNELAYNAAQAIVNEQQSPFNPLFIHGGYGVGKTHLLQGICNQVCTNRPGTNWLYLSAEDFANQFVLALKTKKLEAFRRRIRQTDLLAIDDIHFLASKPSTQEEFLHTFNSIDLAGRQVVLASDAHPRMISELSEKLVNRFISGMVVKIDSPDFATRCEIVRRFAQSKGSNFSEMVVRYIAENLRSSDRELEGACLKIIAFSSMQNKKIELDLVREILADHLDRTDPVIHVADIEAAVAGFFSLTCADLNSPRKDRTASLARHFAMFLARKHTGLSTTEIGKNLGNKNHATVIIACRQIAKYVAADQQLNWLTSAGNRVAKAKYILDSLENLIAG